MKVILKKLKRLGGIMTIYNIEKYDDFFDISSDQEGGLNQDIIELSHDYIKAFYMFFEEFSHIITMLDWDYMVVEFWFDCGQLYLFPEKKLYETPTEYDPYPAERLDPYLIVRLTSYLKKYDAYIDHDYGKFSDSELEEWYIQNSKEVFSSLNIALSDHKLSNFILNSLNRKNIVFRYFGSSKETEYGEKTIHSH